LTSGARRVVLPASLSIIAISFLSGCSPTRSTLPPPYWIDGHPYSAVEIGQRAQAACATQDPEEALPPAPFTTDGCTLWPNGMAGHDWTECCVVHDMAYWCGGPAPARHDADRALRACVTRHGSSGNALMMYLGVSVAGAAWIPAPWRWGYGRQWLHSSPSSAP